MSKKKASKSTSSTAFEPVVTDEITSDVNGSYTGTPIDGGMPVQDADDL